MDVIGAGRGAGDALNDSVLWIDASQLADTAYYRNAASVLNRQALALVETPEFTMRLHFRKHAFAVWLRGLSAGAAAPDAARLAYSALCMYYSAHDKPIITTPYSAILQDVRSVSMQQAAPVAPDVSICQYVTARHHVATALFLFVLFRSTTAVVQAMLSPMVLEDKFEDAGAGGKRKRSKRSRKTKQTKRPKRTKRSKRH